jgi:elongation factor Ts
LNKLNRDAHAAAFQVMCVLVYACWNFISFTACHDQALEGIAMHIAATSPLALDPSSLPREFVEKEQALMADKFKATGKSDDLIQKMLAGSLKKLEAESCLLSQDYVLDDSPKPRTILAIVKSLASEVKQPLAIQGYSMFKLGQ